MLAFFDTGAYQEAGASNFNALPRPGTVLVAAAQAELIRRHETLADVFARDLIPQRLRGDGRRGDGWRPAGSTTSRSPAPTSTPRWTSTPACSASSCGAAVTPGRRVRDHGDRGPKVRWADLILGDGRCWS